ncbi:cyclic nucleotide-binding domain-containing protein [Aestuariivirga litoralis]|uniref:cyclic nucleotide-binding domain-containing protein n=1 Tax=Aestuariivirga litoralis TaxID=2650924 RepID=UPI0018C75605
MAEINMQMFARSVGSNMTIPAGNVIFKEGDPGDVFYIVQSGSVEMSTRGKVTAVVGANKAIGVLSVVDKGPRNATAKALEQTEISVIDERKFRYMLDEVPNFSRYVLEEMARVVRGVSKALP